MSNNRWRNGLDANLTPVQQAYTIDPAEYEHYRMHQLYLGVVLEVFPADSESNRSSHEFQDRRGTHTECNVLCVGTNSSSSLYLTNVIVTTPHPAGLDDYFERLPRPSSNRIDGERLPSSLAYVDPFDLDGDWCIVGFLGSNLDQPFILTWWPHPKNTYDAATSGQGNRTQEGNAQALEQAGRYFHRINGVEFVITDTGNIVLSTKFASSQLTFQENNRPTEGRWPRNLDQEQGGSILVQVKPSQTLELSFDEAEDGFGISRVRDPQLPQTNPRTSTGSASQREKTYVRFSDSLAEFESDELAVSMRTKIRFRSDDTATITADSVLTLDANEVKLGENAEQTQGAVRGFDLYTWLSNMTVLTATGPASINPADLNGPTQNFIDDVVSTKVQVE